MYKQFKNPDGSVVTQAIIRTTDGACIPFDPANTDYANFKTQVLEGAELQDAEGNVIDGIAYLEDLA
jgi:hypothetical protein